MSDLDTLLGGTKVIAKLRDGSSEAAFVRQLAIEFIEQWGSLQGDEAGLVELYCDRQDKVTPQRLRTLRIHELRLIVALNECELEKFPDIEQQLTKLREQIAELEKVQRWDSKLLPESHTEILRIGEELNRPIFDRWAEDRTKSIGQTKTAMEKLRATLPSASSPPSAVSS